MEGSTPTPSPPAAWHIVWQAAAGRDLLVDPALADRIRLRLLAAHRRPGCALLHYLLTPSEIHLLSSLPPDTSPGDVARGIGNVVARWVRQSQGMPGMVFAGRYRAYAIESDEALRGEFRMLAWRPVALGLCRAPTHHATSALRTVLGLRRAMGFDAMTPLRLFGDSVIDSRIALRGRIARRPGPVEIQQWELTRGIALARGAVGTFAPMSRSVRGMAAALVAASQPPTVDGALTLLERWVLVKLDLRGAPVLATLASRAGARGRALVASLAVRLDLCSAASVARHFNRAKATLSERMAACRIEPENRAILDMALARIVEEAIELGRLAEQRR